MRNFAELNSRKNRLNIIRHAAAYVGRHISRSVVKSLLCVGLALLLAGTVGMLTVIRVSSASAYENVRIKAYILDGIPTTYAVQLSNSELVSSSYFEKVADLECNSQSARVVMTNDIDRCSGAVAKIEFHEGYGNDALSKLNTTPSNICVIDRDLAETLGVKHGDKIAINSEFTRVSLVQKFLNPPAEGDQGKNEQMEGYLAALENASISLTVVGIKTPGNMQSAIYVPIASGNGSIAQLFPSESKTLDIAEYVLTSPKNTEEFKALAETKIIGAIGGIGSPLVMDTSEADNLERMLQMLRSFYPVAIAAEVVLGGVFPGLVVLQSVREAAMNRALGMPKRRVRSILVSEQAALCLLGLILSVVLMFIINGAAIVPLLAQLVEISALHLAACVLGALSCAVVVTVRRPLELLQVKE